jgi:predicted RNase H-like nuclease (RuvC/YqgF family)
MSIEKYTFKMIPDKSGSYVTIHDHDSKVEKLKDTIKELEEENLNLMNEIATLQSKIEHLEKGIESINYTVNSMSSNLLNCNKF